MEAKAKSGAPTPKGAAVAKVEKKEPEPPRKPDPPVPVVPETENLPSKDEKAEGEATTKAEEAATSSTDCLEHLKPFLIGGAVVAVGAILLGVILLARRN